MTYEYLCTACDHHWEQDQSISESAIKICPHCHEESAKRLVSGGAGFILKGGGWYADGYGSAQKPVENSGSGNASSVNKESNTAAVTTDKSNTSSADKPTVSSSTDSTEKKTESKIQSGTAAST